MRTQTLIALMLLLPAGPGCGEGQPGPPAKVPDEPDQLVPLDPYPAPQGHEVPETVPQDAQAARAGRSRGDGLRAAGLVRNAVEINRLMKPPEILSECEEGFADLVLAVAADHSTPDGGRCLELRATHKGELVGLRIELPSGWKRSQIGGITSFSGAVTYRSIGDLSDRFVSLLDHLYGVGLDPRRMKDAVSFAAITLGDDPDALDSTAIHMKLFFEHKDQERHAEVYTNVDLPRGVVEIREKDEGYRRALVQALTGAIGKR